jgi:hypothetical protein
LDFEPRKKKLSLRASDCVVLVSSCDAYRDLWLPYFNLFQKHWADCPYPVYLMGNQQQFEHPALKAVLHTDKAGTWSDNLLEALQTIEASHLLFTLEDFFLQAKVDCGKIEKALEFAQRCQAHCVRLVPNPGPQQALASAPDWGVLEPGAAYRVSTQAAIWRRDSLLALLKKGESIWEFELNGTKRSTSLFPDGFYGSFAPIFPYFHHVIERGKWFPWEKWKFQRQAIGCDFQARAAMNFGEASWWLFRKSASLLRKSLKF